MTTSRKERQTKRAQLFSLQHYLMTKAVKKMNKLQERQVKKQATNGS